MSLVLPEPTGTDRLASCTMLVLDSGVNRSIQPMPSSGSLLISNMAAPFPPLPRALSNPVLADISSLE